MRITLQRIMVTVGDPRREIARQKPHEQRDIVTAAVRDALNLADSFICTDFSFDPRDHRYTVEFK